MDTNRDNFSAESNHDPDTLNNRSKSTEYPPSLLGNHRDDRPPNPEAHSLSRNSSVGALDEHESESNETPVAKSTDTSAETDQQHFKGPAGSFVYEPVPPQEDHPIESLNNEGRTRKDNWIWEIVSIILSIGRVVAITVVLAVLDGKPLSLWDMPIRPNSLVSIFAAVSIVALIFPVAQSISQLKWLYYCEDHHALIDLQRFDDASRGPWGSLLFLWHFRTRALIASFGCLITIMALAVDRFTQQIIECPMRSISMGNSSASISVAYMYDTGLEGTTGRASGRNPFNV